MSHDAPANPHETPANPVDRLIDRCFDADPAVRYVAVYRNGELRMRQRPGLAGASAGETDRYEELLVNPAVLTLARQRGEIDCGGLNYVLIRYGNFFTVIHPIAGGHANAGLEPDTDLGAVLPALEKVITGWDVEMGASRST